MYPYYQVLKDDFKLPYDDTVGIQQLYGEWSQSLLVLLIVIRAGHRIEGIEPMGTSPSDSHSQHQKAYDNVDNGQSGSSSSARKDFHDSCS